MAWNYIKDVGDLAVEDNGFDALMVFILKLTAAVNSAVDILEAGNRPNVMIENEINAWLVNLYLPPIWAKMQSKLDAKTILTKRKQELTTTPHTDNENIKTMLAQLSGLANEAITENKFGNRDASSWLATYARGHAQVIDAFADANRPHLGAEELSLTSSQAETKLKEFQELHNHLVYRTVRIKNREIHRLKNTGVPTQMERDAEKAEYLGV